jgi:hypothetical protein
MGYITAIDFVESGIDIDLALTMHLRSNHYPPVPLSMIEPCKAAIDAYWEGDCNVMIAMPEGVSYRGMNEAPAWAIIEQHHLDAWCSDYNYKIDDE